MSVPPAVGVDHFPTRTHELFCGVALFTALGSCRRAQVVPWVPRGPPVWAECGSCLQGALSPIVLGDPQGWEGRWSSLGAAWHLPDTVQCPRPAHRQMA